MRGLGSDKLAGQEALAGIQLSGITFGLRLYLLERTTWICLEFAASSSTARFLVSSSITGLVNGGISMFFWSRLKRVGLAVALCLLVGGLAVHSQTGGQDRSNLPQSRPSGSASALALPSPRTALVIAAPQEVRATGGRGRLLVYDLHPSGERITFGMMDSTKRTGAESSKEVEREYSWAVVTGVVDHQAIRESAKRTSSGNPDSPVFYRRVDLERQARNPDGSWSGWLSVDPTPTIRVVDNIPEEDEEKIEVLVPELVDPLPNLKNGRWQGVNVERLVPQIPVQLQLPHGQLQGLIRGRISTIPSVPGLMGGAPSRQRSLLPELMLRSLDFSVSPGQTYRYRARVVVDARPRYGRLREVLGDWCGPTDAVTVPSP